MALVVKGLVVPLGCPVWCYHFVCSVYHVLDMLQASVHMNIFKKKFLKKYFFNKVADKTPAYCQFSQPTEQIVHYIYTVCPGVFHRVDRSQFITFFRRYCPPLARCTDMGREKYR